MQRTVSGKLFNYKFFSNARISAREPRVLYIYLNANQKIVRAKQTKRNEHHRDIYGIFNSAFNVYQPAPPDNGHLINDYA